MEWQKRVPQYVLGVIDTLHRASHRGYLVGGSLRDLVRGVEPHDYDLTTDATPEEMLEIFADFRVIPTGLKHGTVTVISDGNPIEVTTHRIDGEYHDARRPDAVQFTRRLFEDLSRRDFTVNAMAWNPETGLVDLFDGQGDLARGVLRAVGDAETRFSEDALRILRAFRFSAQLGFDIDPDTLAGARAAAAGLARISVERIFAELCRLLESPHAVAGLRALLDCGCAPYVFFDAAIGGELPDLSRLAPRAALRLAALLPAMERSYATELSRRWHAPNAFAEALCAYLALARESLPTTPYEARRFVSHYWHYWQQGLALHALAERETDTAFALCRQVSRDGSAVELRRLAVNGRELQEKLSVKPARTGALLLRLQDLVWQEAVPNKRAALLEAASAICKEERDFCE